MKKQRNFGNKSSLICKITLFFKFSNFFLDFSNFVFILSDRAGSTRFCQKAHVNNIPLSFHYISFVTFRTDSTQDCLNVYDGKSQVKI